MQYKDKKVLVTGAGGFIGSHLCETLVKKGAKVTAMLHYNSRSSFDNLEFLSKTHQESLNVVRGAVEDASFIDRQVKGQDVVFHLAALIGIPYSYVAPFSYLRTNIEGSVNVLEAVRKFDIPRLVHTSTSEAYGTAIYAPIDEKHPLQGQSPYSASKISADKMAESYFKSFSTPVVTLRPFNTYGPRQSARAIIPTIISQALYLDNVTLGDLTPVRDFNYVLDTVEAFLLAGSVLGIEGETIHVGNGKGITIGELANHILSLLGSSKEVLVDQSRVRPAKSEVFQLLCNYSKAKNMLGWSPKITFKEGLMECIEFVKQNKDFYRPKRYEV